MTGRVGRGPVVINRVGSVHMPAVPVDAAVGLAAALLSVLVGALVVANPVLAAAPIALLGVALLLTDGRARTLFIVFGGMLILQRPGELDASKIGFLAAGAVAFAGALANVQTLRDSPAYQAARPLLAASVALLALAGISLGVAYAAGTPLSEWLRDIAPYVLFATVPVFALDAQASFGVRRLVVVLVAAGVLGVAAWAVEWLQRRGIADIGGSRLAVASLFVPGALFAYAMASALHRRVRRFVWVLGAAAILAVLFSTGTRTTLAFVLMPVAIALFLRRERMTRTVRLLALGPLAALVTLAVAVVFIGAIGANTEHLEERLALVTVTGDPDEDFSYQDRVEQSRVAFEAFKDDPVLGTGPGTRFDWVTHFGSRESDFILDTPVTFPAKFGVLGLLVLLFVVAKFSVFTRRLGRGRAPTVAYLALVGYLTVVAALGLLAPPFEDKGLSFGLILILALVLAPVDRVPARAPERRHARLVARPRRRPLPLTAPPATLRPGLSYAPKRLMLFDWAEGGHHPIYLRRFAEALAPSMEISVAAPDSVIGELADLDAQMIPLGSPRPAIDANDRLRRRTRRITRRELDLLMDAADRAAADHVLHLYADAVLPRLATASLRGVRVSTLLFYPRAHYPEAFGQQLSFPDRMRAAAKEAALAGWREHPAAHAVMTLDEEAARRWALKSGAPAYWVPEPPVEGGETLAATPARSGCILYGALAKRKGIDLLARAMGGEPTPIRITLAGEPDLGFLPRLQELAAVMRRGGAVVELRPHHLAETEALHALASARCAVLPYPRHDGMSRVLLEACSVGTPVIVHDHGLLAHLVRRHDLGLVVDCTDSGALRRALLSLTMDAHTTERYAAALSRFAARFSRKRFTEAVSRPFRDGGAAVRHPGAATRVRAPQA